MERDWRGDTRRSVLYLRRHGAGECSTARSAMPRGDYDMQPLCEEYPNVERGSWKLPVFTSCSVAASAGPRGWTHESANNGRRRRDDFGSPRRRQPFTPVQRVTPEGPRTPVEKAPDPGSWLGADRSAALHLARVHAARMGAHLDEGVAARRARARHARAWRLRRDRDRSRIGPDRAAAGRRVRAFYNVCQHRGNRSARLRRRQRPTRFKCQYHHLGIQPRRLATSAFPISTPFPRERRPVAA